MICAGSLYGCTRYRWREASPSLVLIQCQSCRDGDVMGEDKAVVWEDRCGALGSLVDMGLKTHKHYAFIHPFEVLRDTRL